MAPALTAPFPWFGGKRRAAHLIWPRFGDLDNYVEPFAGSLAVLLAAPAPAATETINDRDAYVANFWRALQHDPAGVERWADYPVSEADLHARHVWLLEQVDFRERMLTDPHFFDAKIAGWWVYGVSSWIGSRFCDYERTNERTNERTQYLGQPGRFPSSVPIVASEPPASGTRQRSRHPSRKLPHLTSRQGICARTHARTHVTRQLPHLTGRGQGITILPRGCL